MTKKENMLNYVEEMMKNKSPGDYEIRLEIHMPTGETEIIVNPNIKQKIEYIKKAYNDDLQLNANNDIYITSCTIGGLSELLYSRNFMNRSV